MDMIRHDHERCNSPSIAAEALRREGSASLEKHVLGENRFPAGNTHGDEVNRAPVAYPNMLKSPESSGVLRFHAVGRVTSPGAIVLSIRQ